MPELVRRMLAQKQDEERAGGAQSEPAMEAAALALAGWRAGPPPKLSRPAAGTPEVMGSEGLHLSLTQTPNLTPKRCIVTELLLAKWLVPSCGAVSEGDYTGQHPQRLTTL